MARRPRLYLIDGTAIAYRAHFAFIQNPLRNSRGENTSAIFGVANSLLKLRREEKPDYWAFVFDRPEPTFRHKVYEEYKATREKAPDELIEQLPHLKELAAALGCPLVELAGYEADDLIATLARQAVDDGCDVVVVSGDKDLMQMVNQRVSIYNPRKAGAEIERLDEKGVEEKFGVPPNRVRDVLALMGDTSDNVPGVPGVGPKTAIKLIKEHGDLEAVLKAAPQISAKGLRTKLMEHVDQARLSMELVTLDDDAPVTWDRDAFQADAFDPDAAIEMFKKYEFRSLVKHLAPDMSETTGDTSDAADDEEGQYHCVSTLKELKSLVADLRKAEWVAVDTETTSLNTLEAELVGISLSHKHGVAYYIPVGHDDESSNLDLDTVLDLMRPVLEGDTPRLIAQNAKYDMQVFHRYGVTLNNTAFDPMIAAFCINPSLRSYSLDSLAQNHCNHTMQPISDLIGKGKTQKSFASVPVDQATYYAAEDADYTYRLFEILSPRVDEDDLRKLFDQIEMPLVPVLARMETSGVRVDADYLEQLSLEMDNQIVALTEEIYTVAGEEFNLNSPAQLGHILFNVLKLTPQRKTAKTAQHATDVSVLEKLAKHHDLPRLMLDYRHVAKLKSTYVDQLLRMAQPATDRVHTSFNQVVAATGRLSSTDPNLQNIPIRTEEGQRIRRAFIPRDTDYRLLAADYSQIELRLMAHFSKDKSLMSAFRDAADVHSRTAAEIFDVEESDVTPEQRRLAKTANFGIIYGVSAFGLSQQSDMTVGEAKTFIDTYFDRYPGVRTFIDSTIRTARESGEVRTLYGRRRFLPDIKSSNRQRREFAERIAVNTPMQGTAADIIKLAMIDIDKQLKDKKSAMVLQVHDELVFDAHESEIDWLSSMVKETMENAVSLDVPLIVDIGVGGNWLDAK